MQHHRNRSLELWSHKRGELGMVRLQNNTFGIRIACGDNYLYSPGALCEEGCDEKGNQC